MVRRLSLFFISALVSLPVLSDDACSFEERNSRAQAFADRMLDEVPSMIESCAMGSFGGIISSTNDLSRWIDIPDAEFFCGFGSDDVWEVAAREMDVEETQSFERHVNHIYESLTERGSDYDYDIPIPDTSYQLRSSKAFKHIFKQTGE